MTLKKLRDHPDTQGIPVIFISSLDSDDHEGQGLRLGAVDYITKPFNPGIVLARIKTQLELKQARDRLHNQNQWLEAEVNRRVQENLLIQDVALTSLTQLAEARDDNTGNHILRTCTYIEILARQLMNQPRYAAELTEQKIRTIVKAAPLHDIGKIGIPDAILLKPGKLSAGEFDIIKTHCQIGARILLVEDNQTNQEVTYQLLEAFGVTIEIVENGLVALEMVKKNPYDLILMDVQMPVMDGLQATAAIRQLPGRQNVPIIAMTANAYAEDRQKCLNAGMNDHLPKPVSPDLLYGMLVNWLEPVQRDANETSNGLAAISKPGPSQPPEPISPATLMHQLSLIPGLDVVTGLQMLQGDSDLYIRILGQFIDLHENEPTQILQALHLHDLKTIQHVTHTLRGSAGTLGAKAIQESAASLEKMTRTNPDPTDPAYVRQIEHLTSAWSDVVQGYRKAVGDKDVNTPVAESTPENPMQVRHILQELHRLLSANDTDVNEQILQAKALLLRSMGDDAQVLEKQILNFDYEDALRTLELYLKC